MKELWRIWEKYERIMKKHEKIWKKNEGKMKKYQKIPNSSLYTGRHGARLERHETWSLFLGLANKYISLTLMRKPPQKNPESEESLNRLKACLGRLSKDMKHVNNSRVSQTRNATQYVTRWWTELELWRFLSQAKKLRSCFMSLNRNSQFF